jgi:hypothetical protein
MPTGSKNVGPVAIFHKGPTPPNNKELLWKDSNSTPSVTKEWSAAAGAWLPIGAVVNITQVTGASVAPVVSLSVANPVRQWAGNQAAGVTVLSWQVTRPAGCPPITAITVGGVSINVTGDSQSGTTNVTTPLNVDTTHTLTVTSSAPYNNQASAAVTVKWQHKRLFFAVPSSQQVTGLSDGALSNLLNSLPAANFDLGAGYSQFNRIFTGSSGAPVRVYEAFLDPSQQATFRVNGALNTAWSSRNFSYTNSDGYATTFRLCTFLREVTGKLSVDTN